MGIFRLALHNVEQNGCQANQWAFHNSQAFVLLLIHFYCVLGVALLCACAIGDVRVYAVNREQELSMA